MAREKSSNQGGKKGSRYAKKKEEAMGPKKVAPIVFRDSPEFAQMDACYATITAIHGANASAMNAKLEKITVSVKKKHRRSIHPGAVVLGSSFGAMYEILHIYTPEQIVVLKDSTEYTPYRLDDDVVYDDNIQFKEESSESETEQAVEFDDI